VDGITIGRFEQDSQNRLLAVKEHLSKGTYQPKPVKRVWIDKPGSVEKRSLGIANIYLDPLDWLTGSATSNTSQPAN